MLDQCLNPRFVGRVFRLKQFAKSFAKVGLNPRFVGRVFRLEYVDYCDWIAVLIPDLWGESSDK